jgi:hypothetical protein
MEEEKHAWMVSYYIAFMGHIAQGAKQECMVVLIDSSEGIATVEERIENHLKKTIQGWDDDEDNVFVVKYDYLGKAIY